MTNQLLHIWIMGDKLILQMEATPNFGFGLQSLLVFLRNVDFKRHKFGLDDSILHLKMDKQ